MAAGRTEPYGPMCVSVWKRASPAEILQVALLAITTSDLPTGMAALTAIEETQAKQPKPWKRKG